MIEDTMEKIKARVERDGALSSDKRAELLKLLGTLEREIGEISKSDPEHAESITGFIERSAHEATRVKKHPGLLKLSLSAVAESVRGFEESHPDFVGRINQMCSALARMGI